MSIRYAKEVPLGEILTAGNVLDNMTNRTKENAIKDLVAFLHKNKLIPDKNLAYERVIEREELAPTALGDGIAIPHARLDVGYKPVIAIGRHESGLDFGASDGKPVRFILLVLWAPDKPGLFNRLFGGLVTRLADPYFRARLLEARDAGAIANEFSDVKVDMLAGKSNRCEADMLVTLQLLDAKKRSGARGLDRQIEIARGELPGSLLSRFDRLTGRYGEALVDAPGGVCGGCNVQLSSSFTSELLKNPDTVYVCERCGRFLIHKLV